MPGGFGFLGRHFGRWEGGEMGDDVGDDEAEVVENMGMDEFEVR